MAPSKIPWLTNPDLFLLREGGIVQVWKCKRTISEALLMKRNDFVYVDDVQNHLDLIEYMFKWLEEDYKKLVKYISERRLLVNGQGLVIAELPKFGTVDGKMDESVSPLFMWSLDIIALDEYMEHYKVRPIPFRPIQYLEDKNGPARDVHEVELSPNELKLTAELEKENNEKNDLVKDVADLEDKKKGLEDDVAKLKDELTAKTNESDAAQRELDDMKSQFAGKVSDLEAKNRVLDGKITDLNAELAELRRRIADLQNQLDTLIKNKNNAGHGSGSGGDNSDSVHPPPMVNNTGHGSGSDNSDSVHPPPMVDPSWMTECYESDWVDYHGLKVFSIYSGSNEDKAPLVLSRSETNFGEDNTTNVRKEFFYGVKYANTGTTNYYFTVKVADIGRQGPAGYAQARFDPRIWGLLDNIGTMYAARNTGRPVEEFN